MSMVVTLREGVNEFRGHVPNEGGGVWSTAGPTSLEDYFQKGALLGQKAALHLWYVDTRPNSQKLMFPSI